uniref:EF-hand domain-containing protein n=1 Tax=Heterorhabditis bacteriophora TaxID=37862 RepID=A0A1I7X0S5_HETBA
MNMAGYPDKTKNLLMSTDNDLQLTPIKSKRSLYVTVVWLVFMDYDGTASPTEFKRMQTITGILLDGCHSSEQQ